MLMPEPMTDTSDDRQPGSSEYVERKEVTVHRFPDADASPPRGIGGSGAGSTVESMPRGVVHDQGCHCWPHTEYAALEAAQRETAKAQDAYERMADDRDGWRRQYAQSRATVAELRAALRRHTVHQTRRPNGQYGPKQMACAECFSVWVATATREEHQSGCLAALDAAEQPARAEEG
jgi:hypothetical protein